MSLGLRGLKIHPDFQKLPIDDPSGIETYRAVARRGLPVLFHMGDDRYDYSTPQRLMNLLRQVPDLRVIAAHFGGWRAWELSYENPLPENVLYDTSSTTPMIPRDFVLRMLDRFGPERFLSQPGKLNREEMLVYTLIVGRVLETFMPPCKVEYTTVDAVCAARKFRIRTYRILEKGWLGIFEREHLVAKGCMPYQVVPDLFQEEILPVEGCSLIHKK